MFWGAQHLSNLCSGWCHLSMIWHRAKLLSVAICNSFMICGISEESLSIHTLSYSWLVKFSFRSTAKFRRLLALRLSTASWSSWYRYIADAQHSDGNACCACCRWHQLINLSTFLQPLKNVENLSKPFHLFRISFKELLQLSKVVTINDFTINRPWFPSTQIFRNSSSRCPFQALSRPFPAPAPSCPTRRWRESSYWRKRWWLSPGPQAPRHSEARPWPLDIRQSDLMILSSDDLMIRWSLEKKKNGFAMVLSSCHRWFWSFTELHWGRCDVHLRHRGNWTLPQELDNDAESDTCSDLPCSDLPSDPRFKAAKKSSLTCVRFTSPEVPELLTPTVTPSTTNGSGLGLADSSWP